MKKLLILLTVFALINIEMVRAGTPIFQTGGKYRGWSHNSQGGITIRCGWQWWMCCFGVDNNGLIWADNWGHVIGTVKRPSVPDDPNSNPIVPTSDELQKSLKVGSKVVEDGSMESWYQFSSDLIFIMN